MASNWICFFINRTFSRTPSFSLSGEVISLMYVIAASGGGCCLYPARLTV